MIQAYASKVNQHLTGYSVVSTNLPWEPFIHDSYSHRELAISWGYLNVPFQVPTFLYENQAPKCQTVFLLRTHALPLFVQVERQGMSYHTTFLTPQGYEK